MGGFFGAVSKRDCILDVFFGTDYHSHLGTRRGGMAAYDSQLGLQREIHNIENSPFRTKFDGILNEMKGTSAIGCISDTDPQPLLIRSNLGTYAICTIGIINNAEALLQQYRHRGVVLGHLDQLPLPQQVAAAVAHIGHQRHPITDDGGAKGTAHAGQGPAALAAASVYRPVGPGDGRFQQQPQAAFLHVGPQAAFDHAAHLLGSNAGRYSAANFAPHAIAYDGIAASLVKYLPGKAILIGFPHHSAVCRSVDMQHLSFPLLGKFSVCPGFMSRRSLEKAFSAILCAFTIFSISSGVLITRIFSIISDSSRELSNFMNE